MFAENRKQFIKSLNGCAAIIIGGQQIIRNGDVHYDFRQSSNFYYLTGFDIPNAIFVLLPKSSKPFVIFTEVKSSNKALWDGPSPSPKANNVARNSATDKKERRRREANHQSDTMTPSNPP